MCNYDIDKSFSCPSNRVCNQIDRKQQSDGGTDFKLKNKCKELTSLADLDFQ